MYEMTQLQLENAKTSYKKLIRNAKSIKKILEKSWLWEDKLESLNFILNNYTLDDHIKTWIYDYCSKNRISHLSSTDFIHRPFTIKAISENKLLEWKKAIEEKSIYHTWRYAGYYDKYDYSYQINGLQKTGTYSAEYKGCWNWHYYMLLDRNKAVFYEDD